MAENTLLTRIQLKYDTLANWNDTTFILKRGEVAIAEIPSSDTQQQQPAIGIKVGDGTKYFRQLPWIQALAGDVYDWAKLPANSTNEVLTRYILSLIDDYGGGSGTGGGGASRQYRIIRGGSISGDTVHTDPNKFYLQQSSNGTDWIDTSYELDFTGPETRLADLEAWAKGSDSSRKALGEQIAYGVVTRINNLNYRETPEPADNTFVTRVDQTKGLVSVTRRALNAADISTGIFSVSRGGTGKNTLASGEVLIGNGTSAVETKPITYELTEANHSEQATSLISAGAVYAYIQGRLSSLANAMHFVGRASVHIAPNSNTNPSISNPYYDFNNAKKGDVILDYDTNNEFIWDGVKWLLLGQDGSFAIKGSIQDADIASNAAIAQSKIAGLTDALNAKVNKNELASIAQENFTTEYKNKLDDIEAGAEVNKIENITLNGVAQPINSETKTAELSIDLSDMGRVLGAKVPNDRVGSSYTDIQIDSSDKKLKFARIAGTGDVADLMQYSNTILVLNCGTASEVIDNAGTGT